MKNSDKETDTLRLNDLAEQHGLTFKRVGSIHTYLMILPHMDYGRRLDMLRALTGECVQGLRATLKQVGCAASGRYPLQVILGKFLAAMQEIYPESLEEGKTRFGTASSWRS